MTKEGRPRPKRTATRAAVRRSTRNEESAGPNPAITNARITKPNVKAAQPKPVIKSPPRIMCIVCGTNKTSRCFATQGATNTCNHPTATCKVCLKQWIAAQLDSNTYDKIRCPECPSLLKNDDVKMYASKAVYERFDELERRGIAEKIPGWRWCMSANCRAGQVHKPLVQQQAAADTPTSKHPRTTPKTKKARGAARAIQKADKEAEEAREVADAAAAVLCTCKECGARACVACDKPFHDGETCATYQGRIAKEERATATFIEKKCKKCPNESCQRNIEKIGGCDHMHCVVCGENFCWPCHTSYTVINVRGHQPGCIYARPGAVDPHGQMPQAQAQAAGDNPGFFAQLVAPFWPAAQP